MISYEVMAYNWALKNHSSLSWLDQPDRYSMLNQSVNHYNKYVPRNFISSCTLHYASFYRTVIYARYKFESPFEEIIDSNGVFHFSVPYAYALEHEVCRGKDHAFEELKRVEGLGGEGVMLREPRSVYVGSRSHTLLKLKSFHDAEVGY